MGAKIEVDYTALDNFSKELNEKAVQMEKNLKDAISSTEALNKDWRDTEFIAFVKIFEEKWSKLPILGQSMLDYSRHLDTLSNKVREYLRQSKKSINANNFKKLSFHAPNNIKGPTEALSSSVPLRTCSQKLLSLAKSFDEIMNTTSRSLSKLSDKWRDDVYKKFKIAFEKQINELKPFIEDIKNNSKHIEAKAKEIDEWNKKTFPN